MPPDAQRIAELWRKIVILYNTTKVHILYCEEMDAGSRTFIQPRNELCNALEHLMRSKASELGLKNGGPDDAYILENLDAALGHEYRAFFDVCDWLSVQLRKKIRKTLEPYSATALNSAVPDYYREVRPQLEQIILEIAAVRGAKDIAAKSDILDEVGRYNAVLEKLKAFVARLPACVAALEELKRKEVEATRRTQTWDVLKLLAAALLGIALTLLARKYF